MPLHTKASLLLNDTELFELPDFGFLVFWEPRNRKVDSQAVSGKGDMGFPGVPVIFPVLARFFFSDSWGEKPKETNSLFTDVYMYCMK